MTKYQEQRASAEIHQFLQKSVHGGSKQKTNTEKRTNDEKKRKRKRTSKRFHDDILKSRLSTHINNNNKRSHVTSL